jgi:hypothetical protein
MSAHVLHLPRDHPALQRCAEEAPTYLFATMGVNTLCKPECGLGIVCDIKSDTYGPDRTSGRWARWNENPDSKRRK